MIRQLQSLLDLLPLQRPFVIHCGNALLLFIRLCVSLRLINCHASKEA